jgi:hypothetical protein
MTVKFGVHMSVNTIYKTTWCHISRLFTLFVTIPKCHRQCHIVLRLTVAIFTGHAPVRGHLYTMGLFDGDPTCRFCRKETETVQHIICCCEVLARQRYVFGNLLVEPKEISTASVRDLCLYIKGTGLLNLS